MKEAFEKVEGIIREHELGRETLASAERRAAKVIATALEDVERCECCGAADWRACACRFELVPDEDPAVGYRSLRWWCWTHGRPAD